jgi:hypothetical protein
MRKGISFLQSLGLVFIILKLGNVIDWDWPAVLAPLMVYYTVVIFIAIMGGDNQ